MKVAIYDPPLCCSSGLCGPALDPALVKMNDAVMALKKLGVEVERFNLAQQPKAFMDNRKIAELLHKNGKKSLPVTLVNDEVFKIGEYPSYEDLCKALGIEPQEFRKPIDLLGTR
jgi:Arsenical resistance operon protein ArsD